MSETVHLQALDCRVAVHCEDAKAGALLLANYRHMQAQPAEADWQYVVGKSADAAFFLRRVGQQALRAANDSEFLWRFEKDFTVELERRRHDLALRRGRARAVRLRNRHHHALTDPVAGALHSESARRRGEHPRTPVA